MVFSARSRQRPASPFAKRAAQQKADRLKAEVEAARKVKTAPTKEPEPEPVALVHAAPQPETGLVPEPEAKRSPGRPRTEAVIERERWVLAVVSDHPNGVRKKDILAALEGNDITDRMVSVALTKLREDGKIDRRDGTQLWITK